MEVFGDCTFKIEMSVYCNINAFLCACWRIHAHNC